MGEGMKVLMEQVEKRHAVSHTAPATVFEKPSEASKAPQQVKSPVQPCTHVHYTAALDPVDSRWQTAVFSSDSSESEGW